MTTRILIAGIALVVLWTLERVAPAFANSKPDTRHDAVNIGLGVVAALGGGAIALLLVLPAMEWSREAQFGLLWRIDLSTPAALVVGFLLLDCWQYIWHRANHAIPLLWRFHAIHHADTNLLTSSGVRFHVGELVLSNLLRAGLLPLLGVSIEALVLYEAVSLPVVLFHHSRLQLPEQWERPLSWVIITPRLHRVHHSAYRPETDSNFASVLSIWDRIFASRREVDDPGSIELGLGEAYVKESDNLAHALARPFRSKPSSPADATREEPAPSGEASQSTTDKKE
jgi:sterol desaturase/sphingolipid hydroxylase (fatty acid hydroxylase superfamily)